MNSCETPLGSGMKLTEAYLAPASNGCPFFSSTCVGGIDIGRGGLGPLTVALRVTFGDDPVRDKNN